MAFVEYTSGLNATQVFVPTALASGASEDTMEEFITAATDGEIGIFDANTNTIVATLTDGQKYFIAQKRVVNGVTSITKSAVVKHTRKSSGTPANNYGRIGTARVGVLEEHTLTVTATATAVGQTFSVKMFDMGWATEQFPCETYQFISVTGAETAAQIAAGIYADYVAQQQLYITRNWGFPSRWTMTVSGAVLTITSVDARTHVQFAIGYDLFNQVTIANTVVWQAAEGEAAHIKVLEYEGKNMDGYRAPITRDIRDYWGTDFSYVAPNCYYDTIYLNYVQDPKDLDLMDNKINYAIAIAVKTDSAVAPAGSALITAIKTILEL